MPAIREQEIIMRAISGGITYDLTSLNSGFVLIDYDGFGISEINRLAQSGPFQAGDTDLGFSQEPRYLMLTWELVKGTNTDLWNHRAEVMGIFRARVADPVQIIVDLPNGEQRATDVNLDGQFDMPRADRADGVTQRAAVSLKASDPRLYDPQQKFVTFQLLSTLVGWEIEETGQTTSDGWNIEETGQATADGWNIGVSVLNVTQTVSYAGNAIYADIEYPLIRIFGPIDSPVLTNKTTGEVIDLSANGGLSLGLGEFVEIDLRYEGGKTIKNQAGVDVSQYLSSDSDLATWHLSYNTELIDIINGTRSDGDNVINVSGTGVTLATRVDIFYYDRYIGM